MRIGLDFRFLSFGRSALNRGVGRFTQQQIREVLKIDGVSEYLLLCRPDKERTALHPEIAAAGNVRMVEIPQRFCGPDAAALAPERRLETASRFQEWLDELNLDLFHVTVPFLLQAPLPLAHDCCPVVFTHYDLIPLVYPEQYFPTDQGEAGRQRFARLCGSLRHADRLLAISEFSRREACTYLGIPAEKIGVASPFADPCFHPLGRTDLESRLAGLARRIGARISDGFVLCVSHLHHSKNLRTLLKGYSALPSAWRARHELVLAFDTTAGEQAVVRSWLNEFGIAGTAVVTGFVSDEELAALYGAAHIFVHPSRHEGFGLPALEALQCAAPVIASDAGALPEVIGDAGVLVNPNEPGEFARALEELDRDEPRRRWLKGAGPRRAERFSPRALGEKTLECYRSVAGAAATHPSRAARARVAMWTPLPPQESGVAAYSGELAPLLGRWADVEIFVDGGFEPSAAIADQFRVFHHSAFERRSALQPFDAVIYQLGASPFHLFMEPALRRWPGVVVLHDLTWSHVLYHLAGTGTIPRNFRKTLDRLEGADAVRELRRIERGPRETREESLEAFLTAHPMLGDVVACGRAAIVHYPHAKREIDARYPGSVVVSLPMGVKDPIAAVSGATPAALRQRWGLARDALLVGIFGFADPVKRLEATLEALASLRASWSGRSGGSCTPDIEIVVVGGFTSRRYEARIRERVDELGLSGRVHILGRVTDTECDELLVACDAVVNLRHPFRKQMSATLMRSIAAGKPVAVTQIDEWTFLPKSFCTFVSVGGSEVEHLRAFLDTLATQPRVRGEMSQAAREYYLQHASLWRMAQGYRRVLEDVVPGIRREANPMPKEPERASAPRFNKVCNIEDFHDPGVTGLIREIFAGEAAAGGPDYPVGHEDRRQWETAMTVRAFRDHGTLRRDATVLGVGAGTDTISFYLTEEVGRVIVTDLYLDPDRSGHEAAPAMLIEPKRFSPLPFDRARLQALHMDARVLDLPDESVDGVFCSSRIAQLGDWTSVAACAYEMSRVLRPGGLLCVSAELAIAGPLDVTRPGDPLLFDRATLQRSIVEASGLEPVDPLDAAVSERTLATGRGGFTGLEPEQADPHTRPNLVQVRNGAVLVPVHITLRKTTGYPVCDNSWARPSDELRSGVRRRAERAADRVTRALDPAVAAGGGSGVTRTGAREDRMARSSRHEDLETTFARWDSIRERSALAGPDSGSALRRAVGFLKRTAKRIRDLGVARDHDREMFRSLLDYTKDLERRLAALEPPGPDSRTGLR